MQSSADAPLIAAFAAVDNGTKTGDEIPLLGNIGLGSSRATELHLRKAVCEVLLNNENIAAKRSASLFLKLRPFFHTTIHKRFEHPIADIADKGMESEG